MEFQKSVVTTSVQVANILREAILKGELLPGTKLREVEISDSLSVSRTPIREAFRILESDGLLEVSPNKGVKVISLNETEICEIYEFRELIEIFAINKACEKISEKDLKYLDRIVNDMEECMRKDDYQEYLRCSTEFHLIYIKLCGNKRIIETFKKNWNSILATQILTKSNNEARNETINDHRKILSAIKKKDKVLAQSLVKEHIAKGLRIARTQRNAR